MKKLVFLGLFVMMYSGVYGQVLPENSWIFGRWIGVNNNNLHIEVIFYNDGTMKWNTHLYLFSIFGNALRIYTIDGDRFFPLSNWTVWRIGDQRMELEHYSNANLNVYLNKTYYEFAE